MIQSPETTSSRARTSAPGGHPAGGDLSARYTRWFHGETERGVILPPAPRPVVANPAAQLVADATRQALAKLGNEAHTLFASRLPDPRRLRRTNRTMVLNGMPQLGSFKFGEILTDNDGDTLQLVQIFIANFRGELDTDSPQQFYRPAAEPQGRMVFGVHVETDRDGNVLGIDQTSGDKGIAFRTEALPEAMLQLASLTTGMTADALRQRMMKG